MTRLAPQAPQPAPDRDPPIAMSAPGAAAATATPSFARELLQDDEVLLLLLKPSLWLVLFSSTGWLMFITIVTLALAWMTRLPWIPWSDAPVFAAGVVAAMIRLAWAAADWANRLYLLTDRRLIRRRGVIRLAIFQAPLRNIQHTSVFVSVRERLTGLGTIGFATSGSDTFEAYWEAIRRPL
jgi:hypothetical protein